MTIMTIMTACLMCRGAGISLIRPWNASEPRGKCYWDEGEMLLSQTRNNASFCPATQ